jgi:hypothetical protein
MKQSRVLRICDVFAYLRVSYQRGTQMYAEAEQAAGRSHLLDRCGERHRPSVRDGTDGPMTAA